MRVISGTAKGRRLASFSSANIRPTSDKVKGSIFNIVASNFGPLEGLKVLDLFSGTGNLGIEALSRGAEKAVFVDENRWSINILKENLYLCRLTEKAEIIQATAEQAIKILTKKEARFNLVFLDPPYGKGLINMVLEDIAGRDILEEGAVIVAEHSLREEPLAEYDGLALTDRRKYGDTEISFYTFKSVET